MYEDVSTRQAPHNHAYSPMADAPPVPATTKHEAALVGWVCCTHR
jgi:hypothetical protein